VALFFSHERCFSHMYQRASQTEAIFSVLNPSMRYYMDNYYLVTRFKLLLSINTSQYQLISRDGVTEDIYQIICMLFIPTSPRLPPSLHPASPPSVKIRMHPKTMRSKMKKQSYYGTRAVAAAAAAATVTGDWRAGDKDS
jgi:hypothetical protein